MSGLPARLVFKRLANDGLPARLIFGDEGVPGGIVTISSTARLSGLRGYVRARVGVQLQGTARLSGLRGRFAGNYDVNVERPLVVQATQHAQSARPMSLAASDNWQDSRPAHVHVQQHLQQAVQVSANQDLRWQDTQALRVAIQQSVQQAAPRVAVVDQSFQDAIALRAATEQRTQQASRLVLAASVAFQDAVALHVAAQSRLQQADKRQTLASHSGSSAVALRMYHVERTQQAQRPGLGVRAVVPPVVGKPCHPDLPAQLIFKVPVGEPLPARLAFTCCDPVGPEVPPAKIIVPVRKAYIVLNSITIHRVDNGAPLQALDFNMQLDFQSWTWSWSATFPESAKQHLGSEANGYPPEFEAKINGIPVRLRRTQRVLDLPFLPKRVKVSGKGKAAVLSDRWAPDQTFSSSQDRTAQQLMNEVLTVNGVSLGWGVDWGIDDWVVPADTWSFQGKYIDAVQDIANAVGAYIQPHNTEAMLRVLPEYPVAPWHWADVTPDYELPAGVAVVLSNDEQFKPNYNAVWISGVKTGSVYGPYGRQGTAKDIYAPQVVHSLITDATAHRQRGLAEISRTGIPEQVTLSMQVLPETGLILPGKFVRFAGVTGLVRGTSVTWQRPAIRQQLILETHPNA